MIISKDAKRLLEEGFIALNPDANLDPTAPAPLRQVTAVKNYRSKILDKIHKDIRKPAKTSIPYLA